MLIERIKRNKKWKKEKFKKKFIYEGKKEACVCRAAIYTHTSGGRLVGFWFKKIKKLTKYILKKIVRKKRLINKYIDNKIRNIF